MQDEPEFTIDQGLTSVDAVEAALWPAAASIRDALGLATPLDPSLSIAEQIEASLPRPWPDPPDPVTELEATVERMRADAERVNRGTIIDEDGVERHLVVRPLAASLPLCAECRRPIDPTDSEGSPGGYL